jgi:hypothetical protein
MSRNFRITFFSILFISVIFAGSVFLFAHHVFSAQSVSDGGSSVNNPTPTGGTVNFSVPVSISVSGWWTYYFAVCKTNSITANPTEGVPPVCNGGAWCISSQSNFGQSAPCSYSTTSADICSQAWYGFLCTGTYDHESETASNCISLTDYLGINGTEEDSPFFVDDWTTYTVGGYWSNSITFGASRTCSQVLTEQVTLYVCKANDFTGSACGIGGEFCHGSAYDNPTCSYSSSSVCGDDAQTYYAFLRGAGGLITSTTGNFDVFGTHECDPAYSCVFCDVSVAPDPSDAGSSVSTPTSAGDNVIFSAGRDTLFLDGNTHYLAVCKTNSVLGHNSAAPTCGGGSWCISESTANGSDATCSYATVAGDIGSQAWYAFECTNSTPSRCELTGGVGQGSGDTGSPFVVGEADPSPNTPGLRIKNGLLKIQSGILKLKVK